MDEGYPVKFSVEYPERDLNRLKSSPVAAGSSSSQSC